MTGPLEDALAAALAGGPLLALTAAFLGGLLTATNPCVMASIPLTVGYVGGFAPAGTRTRQGLFLSLAISAGLATTFTVMGIAAALTGSLFGGAGPMAYVLVAAVCVAAAGHLLGFWSIPMPIPQHFKITRGGYLGAFLVGGLFGLVSAPCAVPVLAVILTLVAVEGKVALGAALLWCFALGHGALILLAGGSAGAARGLLRSERLRLAGVWLQRAMGLVFAGIAGWALFGTGLLPALRETSGVAARATLGGLEALLDYVSAHVVTCLVPAFFIAGAVAVFVSQASVMKYFGARARKTLAYSVASLSGAILAVCSCTILPLFSGIHRRGAGLGPAIAFLFSGPAINILAVVYTARLLGFEIGLARGIMAIVFSLVVGLLMAILFRRDEAERQAGGDFVLPDDPGAKPLALTSLFFAAQVGVLVFASARQWLAAAISLAAVVAILWRWYRRDEIGRWMGETWRLVRLIVPVLLAGVLIAGALKALLPDTWVHAAVGGNGLGATFIAAIFGAFMYFSTLTEVPIVRALVDLGMGRGPALALLLAGPSLSLPNMIVIGRVLGARKTVTYVTIVVILSTLVGMTFGALGL